MDLTRFCQRFLQQPSWKLMIPLVGLVALLSVLKQRTDPATRTLAGVLVDVKTADLNSKISYCIQEKGVEKHKLRFWRYSAFAHVPVGDGETVTTQVSVKQWIEGLTSNKANALDFTRLLKNSPLKAAYFEAAPASAETMDKVPFEFVLVDAPHLLRFVARHPANPKTFLDRLEECSPDSVGCFFPSLWNHSSYIVTPQDKKTIEWNDNQHLLHFTRNVPEEHAAAFFQKSAASFLEAMSREGDTELWLAATGASFEWLHFHISPWECRFYYQEEDCDPLESQDSADSSESEDDSSSSSHSEDDNDDDDDEAWDDDSNEDDDYFYRLPFEREYVYPYGKLLRPRDKTPKCVV